MRTPILSSCFAVCVASALAMALASAQDTTKSSAAQIQHGHDLMLADGCSECHGTVGQGSRASGPRLAPHPVPLDSFVQMLRHPISEMPPYTVGVLSDDDARDIHAYLASIPDPSQKVTDIPGLNH